MANLESLMQSTETMNPDDPPQVDALLQALAGENNTPLDDDPAPEAAKADPAAPVVTEPTEPAKPADAATPAATEPAKTEETPATPAIQEPQVVLAKDGKNTIPYSILEGTRKAREMAEQQKAELAKALDEAKQTIAALQKGATTTEEGTKSADELEAEFATIAEEAPWLSDTLKKVVDKIRNLETKLDDTQKRSDDAAAAVSAAADPTAIAIREAIDSVPALASWEAEKPELFNDAIVVDKRLRELPEWKDKPYKERFEKVVSIIAAMHGDSVLPPDLKATSPPVVAPAAKKLPDANAPGISTLTDLPGGTPTAQNALSNLENASPTAILNQLSKLESVEDILRFVTSQP